MIADAIVFHPSNTLALIAGGAVLALGGHAPAVRLGWARAGTAGGSTRRAGAAAAVLGAGLLVVLARRFLLVTFAAVILGATVTHLAREHRVRRKELADGASVATAMTIVAGELRAGARTATAIERAGEELEQTSPEIGTRLQVAARTAHAGGDGARSLIDAGETIPALGILGRAWSVAQTHGISQLDMVEQARGRIEKSLAQAGKNQAKMQGAQVTAIILAIMPVLGIGMGFAMGVNVLAFLLTQPIGGILLVLGVGLESAGLEVAFRIMRRAT